MLKSMDDDEFTIFTQEDFLETFNSIIGIIEIALIAISSISLIVGGIGIMNIMLVSVTERIKEIGLRRALGATSGNIAFQFMTESILVSILGGILGLLVGACATIIAQRWIQAEIKPGTIALALGFSIAVGVLFGTYPAVKASKLDPIEALRYE
ncbi:MAG: FtsX-like permease family protein [Patescibacteria group bacterium]